MHRKRRLYCCWIMRSFYTYLWWILTFSSVDGYAFTPGGPVLLYATTKDIRIANTSKPGKVITIVKDLQESTSVDFYSKKQLICWTDHVLEMIQCVTYNGTSASEKMQVVTNGLIAPNGLAIDWYTGKLYWADGETKRIEVATVDGRHRKVLFWTDIDQPRAIAVVPMKGLMFWTDWGEVPKIERAGMNGDPSTRRVIINKDIFWPNGLTIDYETNKIYWLDAKLKFINVMDYDGANRKTIVKDGLIYAYALTLFGNRLYWTDWSTWSIHSWDMSSDGPIREVIHSEEVPMDISVLNAQRQPPPPVNINSPCLRDNANCSHLCLISPDIPGYNCACPTGVKLLSNNSHQCADGPSSLLILVQRTAISRISLDLPDYTPFTLPLHGVKHAIAADYDSVEEYIYWSDDEVCSISRARIDGSDQSVVISGEHPHGLAVDSLARNLYWTDPHSDTISMARLNGSCRKVVIYKDLYEPRAIAVAPTLGWMFWSDWHERKPKIERASLDGSERVLLVSEKLAWPNGIALDVKAGKLYWADAKTDKIEICNMDGSDRTELISDNLPHIFGLSLLGDYIYWTDWQRRSLDRAHKITGREREIIVEQLPNMMGLKAFRLNEPLGTNVCTKSNGNCSHLCFNRPNGHICGCPIDLELEKDQRTCAEPSASLLYARKDKIGRISIENQGAEVTLPIKDLKDASAMAVHVSEGKIYWADTKNRNIGRCNLNGTNSEKIIEWIGFVEGIAIDWAGQNIYWTDSGLQRIEVARLDGSSRKVLIWQGLKKPKSIAVDPKRGFMYWSEWGSKNIKRASMDGTAPSVLIQQVVHANALTIDYENKSLIWVTLDPPCIEISDLDGQNRRKLISENIVMPFALTIYQEFIYWADWNTGDIERALKLTGGDRVRIHSKLEMVSELAVLHSSRQPLGANLPCSSDNDGCERLCLPISGGKSRCACPTHYKLKPDNLTCSPPTEFILYAQKNAIGRLVPGSDDCPDAAIPISGLRNVRAVDYDPVKRHIYWMDGRGTIRRILDGVNGASTLNSTPAAVGLARISAMAIDPIGRRIYWAGEGDCINVTRLENATNTNVVMRGVHPKHLAVHADKRLLFWSDVSLGNIMRSAMDGSQRMEVIKAQNVTAIMVDPKTNSLYWASSRQILACDLDGGNRRVVWQGGSATALGRSRSSLCWTDSDKSAVQCAASSSTSQPQPARTALHALHLQHLVAVAPVDTNHACFEGGSCGAAACLADGACGCSEGACAAADCGARHFACGQGPECVPAAWRCDGQSDCPDGSDELGCGRCGADFRCGDGACVDRALVCDGAAHCRDGDDEADCCDSRADARFRCPGTRVCLPVALVCDRREHCADGADESPAACARRDAQADTSVAAPAPPAPRGASPGATVAGALAAVAVVAVAAGALFCWRRRAVGAGERGRPAPQRVGGAPRKPAAGAQGESVRLGALERGRPAGASSPSAAESLLRYPRETLNPPPSPATASSAGATPCRSGRWRPYRHYRSINRPPPPTPCSTDACESDCAANGRPLEAPPPTPCPPSPPSPSPPSRSSRSSACFSPFPPPPSPVPNHYDP